MSRAFPPYSERQRQESLTEVRRFQKGHGRLVTRHLQASSRLAKTFGWPGLAQVLRLERTTLRNGHKTVEVQYAITSLSPDRASAAQLSC